MSGGRSRAYRGDEKGLERMIEQGMFGKLHNIVEGSFFHQGATGFRGLWSEKDEMPTQRGAAGEWTVLSSFTPSGATVTQTTVLLAAPVQEICFMSF